jgi:hypothetical protein
VLLVIKFRCELIAATLVLTRNDIFSSLKNFGLTCPGFGLLHFPVSYSRIVSLRVKHDDPDPLKNLLGFCDMNWFEKSFFLSRKSLLKTGVES